MREYPANVGVRAYPVQFLLRVIWWNPAPKHCRRRNGVIGMVCPQVFAIVFVVPRFHRVPFSLALDWMPRQPGKGSRFSPLGISLGLCAANPYAAD